MANQVSWFEVVGQDGEKLRSFYGDVFGWKFNLPAPEMNYGMTEDPRASAAASARRRAGRAMRRSTSASPIRRPRSTRSRALAARPSCR